MSVRFDSDFDSRPPRNMIFDGPRSILLPGEPESSRRWYEPTLRLNPDSGTESRGIYFDWPAAWRYGANDVKEAILRTAKLTLSEIPRRRDDVDLGIEIVHYLLPDECVNELAMLSRRMMDQWKVSCFADTGMPWQELSRSSDQVDPETKTSSRSIHLFVRLHESIDVSQSTWRLNNRFIDAWRELWDSLGKMAMAERRIAGLTERYDLTPLGGSFDIEPATADADLKEACDFLQSRLKPGD